LKATSKKGRQLL